MSFVTTKPKGQVFVEPLFRFTDPVTGCDMKRLTDLGTHSHHPYFYMRLFTPDGKKLLYISHRYGYPAAHLLDHESGESRQLTDTRDIDAFLLHLSPDGRFLFYCSGSKLFRRDLQTLSDVVVYEQQPPFNGRPVYPGFSPDGSTAFLAQIHRDDVVNGKSGWDGFEPQWRKKPRCRLLLLDLETGKNDLVVEKDLWLGHPQIRPGDPSTLMYCHEGPGHMIDNRIWLIGADGKNQRPVAISRREKGESVAGEIVTHEYFTPDGRHAACAYLPPAPDPGRIFLIEPETLALTDLGPVKTYLHFFHSENGKTIVGDEGRADSQGNKSIWLFDPATRKEKQLCLHNSSLAPRGNSTQDAHPHPSFSPDGKFVVFSSDRETSPDGNCAVYLASTEGFI
jgi:oligogalacturonide lyase